MSNATIPVLEAVVRDRTGTRYAARLRKEGRMPAVVYGHGLDTAHISVDDKIINEVLHSHAHLIMLNIDGKEESCVIKDVQWNHMSSHIIHVDFTRVDLNEEVTVEVDITIKGDAVGLKTAGAILEHPLDTLQVICKATDIPEIITVDVSDLEAGKTITVADLQLADGVKAITDAETIVASVNIMAEQPEEEGEAADGEPEVIGRPAKEEEAK